MMKNLYELAEYFVYSVNDSELPIKREDLTEECLKDFLNARGYDLTEEQMNTFINYILSCSDFLYNKKKKKAASKLQEDLDKIISEASDVLPDLDILKIILGVINDNFCD